MSSDRPVTSGAPRPDNIGVLLRDAFRALNDLVIARLVEAGFHDIRPAHAAVFQFVDETGTTVSRLAERAQMTKQAMAELVAHLEARHYVERRPDPADRRAKLVVPTERGREVIAVAQRLVPGLEDLVETIVGARRMTALRTDLEAIRREVGEHMINP